MAKCIDCLHQYCCKYDRFFGVDEVENKCNYFKNKSTFVEIVRCKDCIYNEIGNCKHKADYFCANGTPKNEEEKNNDVFK